MKHLVYYYGECDPEKMYALVGAGYLENESEGVEKNYHVLPIYMDAVVN